jgi:hypothetical protein
MWKYDQASGVLTTPAGTPLSAGYSGAGSGQNNPAMQDVPDVGPIPRGMYTIGEPFDSPTHGPFVMTLTPDSSNEMFGRSGFLLHGDSTEHPGCASLGCMVQARPVREVVDASCVRRLQVV